MAATDQPTKLTFRVAGWWRLYGELKNVGFDESQAFELVKIVVKGMTDVDAFVDTRSLSEGSE